jgi:hypothetical protein
MKRLVLVCAIFGLCAMGCSKAADSPTSNANKATVAVSPSANAAATPAAQPAATASPEKSGAKFEGDPTGAYFATGTLPADFAEIDHLNLATIDENAKPAPLNGFIRPKRRSAKDYKLVNPKLDGRNLTFTTEAVDGVSYSFTGAFEKMGDFAADPPPTDEVILKGTLTRTKDGKATEAKVNFTYSAGG